MNRTTILQGDVLECLSKLPDESVHCVVTSPPYWGLRDYGVSGQIGLEPTMAEYVQKMVEVFREVRRVLRKDGVVFANLGDSYASGKGTCFNPGGGDASLGKSRKDTGAHPLDRGNKSELTSQGLKPKDLCGIPWRVALALQDDGWYLRSDIIWAKPNPMPESVTDRPTRSHEYIFLLTKSPKYFWDAEAVREPHTGPPVQHFGKAVGKNGRRGNSSGMTELHGYGKHREYNPNGRNLRTVWNIATESFPEAHFATFPQKMVEKCIKAGTSEKGCCPQCGAPWVRVVEKGSLVNVSNCKTTPTGSKKGTKFINEHKTGSGWTMDGKFISGWQREIININWQPFCACGLGDTVPCTVLDPFLGSGTTALVAAKMGRDSIGIELKPQYADMAARRIWAALGMMVEISVERPEE